MFRGDKIYVRTLTKSSISARNGRTWQYHSRSDAHSKAACWSIVLDLLATCSLLREHVKLGKVRFGINHEMRDFRMNRKNSPVLNKDVGTRAKLLYSKHVQPKGARRVLDKIKELPRRSGEDGDGYDALGAVFVECRNDGSEISIVGELTDGTVVDPIITYHSMIQRISSSYTSRFRAL